MSKAPALNGDIPIGDWIDRLLPPPVRPYCRLMRLDRPIGTWLLLYPCLWSIALAQPDWGQMAWLFALFGLGALVMRGTGCTINDIFDRDFDARVERTKTRPIACGQISVPHALAFLALQLAVGLAILLQLGPFDFWLGVASLALVVPYPLMKRITYWPQAWLGLTFNWGALMGWAAVRGQLDLAPLLLYAGGLFWTLGYDTIYAHQDKDDDALVGVKSTALKLGAMTRRWLVGFYGAAFILFTLAGLTAGLGQWFVLGMIAAGLHLVWQILATDFDVSADCLDKFRSNRWFGLMVLAAIFLDRLIP